MSWLLLLFLLACGAAASSVALLRDPQRASVVVEFVDTLASSGDDPTLAALLLNTAPFDGTVQTQAMLAVQLQARLAMPTETLCSAFGTAAADILGNMRAFRYPYASLPAPFADMNRDAATAYYMAACRATTGDHALSASTRATLMSMGRIAMAYISV
jgi:hypothetical protein